MMGMFYTVGLKCLIVFVVVEVVGGVVTALIMTKYVIWNLMRFDRLSK